MDKTTVKVIFEYDEASGKWEVFVENCKNDVEARQAFNAVLLTARQAIPRVDCNKATPVISPLMNLYKISIGQ